MDQQQEIDDLARQGFTAQEIADKLILSRGQVYRRCRVHTPIWQSAVQSRLRLKRRDAMKTALDALEEVMVADKGFSEEEWVEFCNRMLPFMHAQGRLKHTVSYH